ncbi:MAG: hypothetical protein MJA83_18440 [Gammaproteobacteria bacterium]|nr:hypothetical protein [Gammaproteobacteria bacterium]
MILTDDIPDDDQAFARNISYPMRFTQDADLFLDENEEVIDQSLFIIVFTRSGFFLLTPELGNQIEANVFDPLDSESTLQMDTSLRNGIEANDPRVFIDREFEFDETTDSLGVTILIPYTIVLTGESVASKFIVPRNAVL